MTAHNEEKMREAFEQWSDNHGYETWEKSDAWNAWKAVISQGEQERNGLKQQLRFYQESFANASANSAESQKREAELQEQLAATELVVEQMREVLRNISKCQHDEYNQMIYMATDAAQLQPSLSALREHEEKVLEDAEQWIVDEQGKAVLRRRIEELRDQASELRAKGDK